MKENRYFKMQVVLQIMMLFFTGQSLLAQTGTGRQEDPNSSIFMTYLKNNWDDIHDVIMRFHNDNPGLKGVVYINMSWQEGKLASATVDSNDTGDPAFGLSLTEAMKKWQIPGLADGWIMTVPFRTAIYGSNDPMFSECGIFTGNVADNLGNPVKDARIIMIPGENVNSNPDTTYTNREGVFIRTLIRPGEWRVECNKEGYLPAVIGQISVEKRKHIKYIITMKKD
jgi:hypothetical protein